MLDIHALKISLDSIIELGSNELTFDTARQYYILYNNTLEYIKNKMEPDGELSTYYNRFPKLKYYDIDTVQNEVMGYVDGFFDSLTSARIVDPDDDNPAKVALLKEIRENLPEINMVVSELLFRMGED